jgi:hypothetical protein
VCKARRRPSQGLSEDGVSRLLTALDDATAAPYALPPFPPLRLANRPLRLLGTQVTLVFDSFIEASVRTLLLGDPFRSAAYRPGSPSGRVRLMPLTTTPSIQDVQLDP